MKFLNIFCLVLNCNWFAISETDVEINMLQNMIYHDSNQLRAKGICGGTLQIEVFFNEIEYCYEQQLLHIEGYVQTKDSGELYPNSSLIIGQMNEDYILKTSSTFLSDTNGYFNISTPFKSEEELFIYGLGTIIIKAEIKIPTL